MQNNNDVFNDKLLSVSVSDIPKYIEQCQSAKVNLLVIGDPGTGKTTSILGMQEKGWKVTMLTGSSTYEETVNGIPYNNNELKTENSKGNLQVYTVPEWLDEIVKYKGKQILFIDEFNTADEIVMKTFLSVLTERKVPTQPDKLKLPDDCVIVAAMNPENQNNGTELIRPHKSRFFKIKVESELEKFIEYAVTADDINLPESSIRAMLEQIPNLIWLQEAKYNDINPRACKNFLKMLSNVDPSERSAECKSLSIGMLGFELKYIDENSEEFKTVTNNNARRRGRFLSEDEIAKCSDEELNELLKNYTTQIGSADAMKACVKIKAELKKRQEQNN